MLTGFVMARQVVHWFGSLVKMLVQSQACLFACCLSVCSFKLKWTTAIVHPQSKLCAEIHIVIAFNHFGVSTYVKCVHSSVCIQGPAAFCLDEMPNNHDMWSKHWSQLRCCARHVEILTCRLLLKVIFKVIVSVKIIFKDIYFGEDNFQGHCLGLFQLVCHGWITLIV